jgi:Endonuclease NucS
MASTASPFIVSADGAMVPLVRVAFDGKGQSARFDEDYLQALLYKHPELIPCADIDSAYRVVVPLCREMRTSSGFVDLVGVTPEGNLVIVETKLWRNPQARREVVAQLLDYAKDLAQWTYSRLELEVKKVTPGDSRSLYERVAASGAALDESSFCDQVSRQLRTGQFMLLIVGDGIREGVGDLASFLDEYGSLQFSFGLIEVAVFDLPMGGRLFSASVVAKTALLKRVVFLPRFTGDAPLDQEDGSDEEDADIIDGPSPDRAAQAGARLAFWNRLRESLHFDDVSQPMPGPTSGRNIFFQMPPAGGRVRLSAYLGASKDQIGVYINCKSASLAGAIWDGLRREEQDIRRELGFEVGWPPDRPLVLVMDKMGDLGDPSNEERVLTFFREKLNRFVSVFRPRLERIAQELKIG